MEFTKFDFPNSSDLLVAVSIFPSPAVRIPQQSDFSHLLENSPQNILIDEVFSDLSNF